MELATVQPPMLDAVRPLLMNPVKLRKCLGEFATGVTVITYAVDGAPRGVTVNSFTSVSMDPPLVLVSIGQWANAATGLKGAPFVVNVLATDQLDLAQHFAGRPHPGLMIPWEPDGGTPRLHGCVARIGCAPWKSVAAGDHILFLGQITECEQREAEALLFHGGQFRSTGRNSLGSAHDVKGRGQP
jgi:flavin reductase (DIM6/NTAB) family NADH-FMN oxidoreductase RutF